MTDSGGLQKEAFFFEKNCVTMRDQTEWIELVEHGYNLVVGADQEKIIASVNKFMGKKFVKKRELYGQGDTAQQIYRHLLQDYNNRK